MRLSNRARGVAAAMFLLALGTINPTPSRAWQMDVPANVPAVSAPVAPAEAAPAPPAPAVESLPQIAPQPAVEIGEPAADAAVSKAEENCLATAVYFEAKGEPRRGQLAVAQVVVNRTRSGRFPRTVCGVVKQRGQFSFVHGGHLPAVSPSNACWQQALSAARKVLDGSAEKVAANALFFHARGVSAGWHAVRVAQIGNQVFYR
jgi:spore germination cell wall hydrolase CwlJ-like protein